MGDGDVDVLLTHANGVGELFDFSEDTYRGGAAALAHNLDTVPLDQATPQRLGHGLFRGPSPREVAFVEAVLLAVRYLRVGEETFAYPGRAFEGELHALAVNHVHPDSWHHEAIEGTFRSIHRI